MAEGRRVAVVTGTRADYGLLRPTIARLDGDPRFELQLIVAAMHLDPRYGDTVSEIEFPVSARVDAGPDDGYAARMATALASFERTLAVLRPDVLVVLGDRWEILSAALAATGRGIPIAHLHGGELSEGSLDDAMRHSITKLAHLHFAAARPYAERIVQLGEDPARVYVAGAAALESIATLSLLDLAALQVELGLELARPLASLTFHPSSLTAGNAQREARELALAVEDVFESGTVVVSLPNDDPGSADVRAELLELSARRPNVTAFESLGQLRYLSLLRNADVVVGNSSSGVLEAPSFGVPVVNVGDRQRGRLMPATVLHSAPDREQVASALRSALAPGFRQAAAEIDNPYGDGRTSQIVVDALAAAALGELRDKRFHDLPDGPWRDGLRLAGEAA
jgi:UDP-hydrolysing UDP-N-acetyl-D-glucosamine 2-epimerase